jgi:hypothetical protein
MVSLPDERKIKGLITELFHVNAQRAWILMTYSNPTTVVYNSHGTGPLSEVVSKLKDTEIAYIMIRFPLHDAASHVSPGAEIQVSKIRDAFIAWYGPKVGIIERGKKKSHVGALQGLCVPVHCQLEAKNLANFTEENLKSKSDPAAGSHIID